MLRHFVLAILAPIGPVVAFALATTLSAGGAAAQVGPDDWYFEIDGDYGSVIKEGKDKRSHKYEAPEVYDGGFSTWGMRDASYCTNWLHNELRPYMGEKAYWVYCGVNDADTRRSEQMMLGHWGAGYDKRRYFSFAYRLPFVSGATERARGYIAQWHQGGVGPPPVRVQWNYRSGKYYLDMIVYYDQVTGSGCQTGSHTFAYDADRGEFLREIELGVWQRMLVAIDPGPALGKSGTISAYVMNNETGLWESLDATYTGPIGFASSIDGETCDGSSRLDQDLEWKIGQYTASDGVAFPAEYDNVAYGKRWNNITKNRLIGYHKSVLRLRFAEMSRLVNDTSWLWNGGQQGDVTSDYNNDGEIQGSVSRVSSGVTGYALRLDGSNYVSVPMDATDFDFGNYVTVSTWFRTSNHPTANKGLVMIDEYSTSWKLLLYTSDTLLSFGVRHPDNTYSKVNHSFPAGKYADGEWHHVVGTFNRFSNDDRRVKLYIDGVRISQVAGSDLPILRGNDRLTVGKFSVNGYFKGDIDEVNVLNHAMTADEVYRLYREHGLP